ncbi:MAG: hypothetical protein ABSB19_17350 [Methylomonas sp.]|jgi:hypothetical protein
MDSEQTEILTEPHQAALQTRQILASSDFKEVVASAAGRRFVRRLLAECGLMQSSVYFHADRPLDALEMAYNEGRRSIGRRLVGLFSDLPEQYLQLMREQMHEGDA